jgi:hypothetical protein
MLCFLFLVYFYAVLLKAFGYLVVYDCFIFYDLHNYLSKNINPVSEEGTFIRREIYEIRRGIRHNVLCCCGGEPCDDVMHSCL